MFAVDEARTDTKTMQAFVAGAVGEIAEVVEFARMLGYIAVAIVAMVWALLHELRSQDSIVGEAMLKAGREKLAESRQLNRIPLAAREFERAEEALAEAAELLASEPSPEALSAAEQRVQLLVEESGGLTATPIAEDDEPLNEDDEA